MRRYWLRNNAIGFEYCSSWFSAKQKMEPGLDATMDATIAMVWQRMMSITGFFTEAD